MIERIGVLCQDRNSFGFLLGMQRRLNCEAELIEPGGPLAKSTMMSRRQAKLAVLGFEKQGVDLILRFTDADGNPWNEVKRHELAVFPDSVSSILVCGVAVDNVEQWLALDCGYAAGVLQLDDISGLVPAQLTGVIKNAIVRARRPDEPQHEVSARFVAEAPPEVFREWLKRDDSLRVFYQECRAAAISHHCQVPNEMNE